MVATRFGLEVHPLVPAQLQRLPELAGDLVYSWDRRIRRLFHDLDPTLWETCSHNPKAVLHQVAQPRLERLAQDADFLDAYHDAVASYDHFLEVTSEPRREPVVRLAAEHGMVAYFCAEYGFHESVKLYSGGLGVLAADHCKAASSLGAAFVAVGLMYREGYFAQTITATGAQAAHYPTVRLADLPAQAVRDASGQEIRVGVNIGDRCVALRAWQVSVGRVQLYLLDSDVPENNETDRGLTRQLYGGDEGVRIAQEIILGVGGVRVLRALNLAPTAWHMNEGHAAFLVIERCREVVAAGLDFDSALEQVAAATVFTTHTPVPAGHDRFAPALVARDLASYASDLGISMDRLLDLGADTREPKRFNMTSLALRSSRYRNGVSRIHGREAATMAAYVWPQIAPHENPMRAITNGVHIPTFMGEAWLEFFDTQCKGWRRHLCDDAAYWRTRIEAIPDVVFWNLHLALKIEMLRAVRGRLRRQYRRNQLADATIERLLGYLSPEAPDVLVLGFARRMATYKRVLLLFQDPARLVRVLDSATRCPVVMIFAGKAHPQDQPGQELIRQLNAFAQRPEFRGRLFFVEDYDLSLGRSLVAGVDVWLNTPLYPLEACGTSGQKAGMNGVLNVSIMDGWWPEACDGTNGWGIAARDALTDREARDHAEAAELLDILEQEVIPMYCDRDHAGFPRAWVARAKRAMQTVLPYFNAQRMFSDYLEGCYLPATEHGRALVDNDGALARQLAGWKRHVRACWPGVRLQCAHPPTDALACGEQLPLEVSVRLNGLKPEDVCVECVFGDTVDDGSFIVSRAYPLQVRDTHDAQATFAGTVGDIDCGRHEYRLRCFPQHEQLAHRFEMGCMVWA